MFHTLNNIFKFIGFTGFLFHAVGIILAVIVPVAFSLLRLPFSSQTMNWYLHLNLYLKCKFFLFLW